MAVATVRIRANALWAHKRMSFRSDYCDRSRYYTGMNVLHSTVLGLAALTLLWDALPALAENSGDVGVTDPSDPVQGRRHWAFQPLRKSALPAVRATEWPRQNLDRFVLAKLEAAGLSAPAEADRRTLARRTFLQLIGLPPRPEELVRFLADRDSGAFERLVDRLLASPHFGERWGRHWLDLARYADSNGLDENFLFREAWRYRNRVVDSVNEDLPYDRFVLEEIAGDLLHFDSVAQRDRQRLSAGFLVLGPKVLIGNASQERRMDVADEQLDTIGRAILGLTIGCARCHDHKFDPIPTTDYYALAGIMTSTMVMEHRTSGGSQKLMERLVGLGPDGDTANAAYEDYWKSRPQLVERHKQAEAALELIKRGDNDGLAQHNKNHADTVAAEALDAQRDSSERQAGQQTLIDRLAKKIDAKPSPPARGMIPRDMETPADESVRLAGQYDDLGEQVPRGVLQVVSDTPVEIPPGASGRRELADWLTNSDSGAGVLAARVLANRVWHHLMGRGIVRTVDNFGRTGERPTHPALLDHLADELIQSGWSLKSLVRRIVLSRTFAISSRHDASGQAIDPDNRLLWRAHRRRLDPETLRDSMLLASGQLNRAPLGSSVWYFLGERATEAGANKIRRRTDFPNRSVYLPVIRNDLPELFDAFDFADPHCATGMRPETLVATQGLFMLNDKTVMQAAEATARRIMQEESSPDRRVERMFELILSDRATESERSEFVAFHARTQRQLAEQGETDADVQAWAMACQALFASSRFQIVE